MTTFPVRSGCFGSTPVDRTATVTPAPCSGAARHARCAFSASSHHSAVRPGAAALREASCATDAGPLTLAAAGKAQTGATASAASSGSVPRVNQVDFPNAIHSSRAKVR